MLTCQMVLTLDFNPKYTALGNTLSASLANLNDALGINVEMINPLECQELTNRIPGYIKKLSGKVGLGTNTGPQVP